jgi:hypothetical protein
MTERTKLYTLEELVEAFDLNRVHKAGANLIRKKQMVQSPTFDQTRDEDLAHTFAYRCFKITVQCTDKNCFQSKNSFCI